MPLKFFLSSIARPRVLIPLTSLFVLSFLLLLYFDSSPVSIAGSVEGGNHARQNPQNDPQANKPHWLVGSYYSTQNGLTATLLLNNKGNQPLEVRPTLYSLSGQAIEIPPITVDTASFRFVNLQEWAAMGGESFSQGSIKLFHVGKDLVLGAQIYLTDEAHSLSFEEKLAEVDKFDSRRFEGVWWMPSRQAEVQIVLSNTTDAPLSVTARLSKRPHHTGEAQAVELAAHETRVLDLRRDFADGDHFANSQIIAVSLQHAGAKSALLARAMVKEEERGYSSVVQFSNPAGGKSSEYQGGTTGDYGCNPSTDFGIQIAIVYQVLDQASPAHPIGSSAMLPQETFTNVFYNGVHQADSPLHNVGPTHVSGTSSNTTDTGTFKDAPFGNCSDGTFTLTLDQNLTIALGSISYPVRINSFATSSNSLGHGGISNSLDISASR